MEGTKKTGRQTSQGDGWKRGTLKNGRNKEDCEGRQAKEVDGKEEH